jgi:integrase
VHLSILTGMRRGEVLGLWWSDIDFDSRKLHVMRTLKEGTRVLPDGRGLTRPVYNDPKTKKSRREVHLEQPAIAALLRHRTRQREQRLGVGPAWEDRGVVFTNPLGGEVYVSNVYQKYVRWVRRNGLRRVRPHDLRHTYATLALGAGAELEKVSRALGHSSIAITMDLYASHVPGIAKEAMEKVARSLYEPTELGEVEPGVIRAAARSRANGGRSRSRTERPRRWQGDA